uniref:Frenatin-2D n=1 Tax=Discoglossus sardus TaxID=191474 RepID=FRE2D_DISSA|nr:RecName: Full=Frenatin-2D; AltName: Full=Host-defense peptide [Discoglossus sardus]
DLLGTLGNLPLPFI